MSNHKLFYQSGAEHAVVSHGLTTRIKIDMAFDFLRINVECQEHYTDSQNVKDHLMHVVSCIKELESEFNKTT